MSLTPDASHDGELDVPGIGACALTYTSLNVNAIVNSVGDDGAGATAIFIGTTRNSFKGKIVTRLEYQAYTKLALNCIAGILSRTKSDQPHLIKIAVHHRLGTVDVGQPSIVIAVSSPHRKDAFVACETILEQVKDKAQIWKREYYEGEDEAEAMWKENH